MIKVTCTLALLIAALAGSSASLAATQTVTLDVPSMTCSACPITVKKALMKVDGVQEARPNLEKREVVVTFDDSKTNTANLELATENAGYPGSVKVAN